jgi:GDPmannose 4,6-dehydratase
MLQEKKPNDYVISTGNQITVKQFVSLSAKRIGIKLKWKNKGLKEIGIDQRNNNTIIKISKAYFRKTEVDDLLGNYSKAKKELKWKPKITLNKLIDDMVANN